MVLISDPTESVPDVPVTLIFRRVAWDDSKSLQSSLYMTGKWQEKFNISAEDIVTRKSVGSVLVPGEDERPLFFWVSPETKSVLQEVLKWILATTNSCGSFQTFRVPQIIQNWTILVLKPMVLGILILGNNHIYQWLFSLRARW